MNDLTPPTPSLEEWRRLANASLSRGTADSTIDDLCRQSEDGIIIKALYTAEDMPDPVPIIGKAGWVIAQEIEIETDAKAVNEAILAECTGGVGRIDLPAGFDFGLLADAPAQVFDGVVVEAVAWGLAPNSAWRDGASALKEIQARLAPQNLTISLGVDPINAVLNGTMTAREARAEAGAVADWLIAHGTDFTTPTVFAIAGDDYHLKGLTDGEEIAVILASTVFALKVLEKRGIGIEHAFDSIEWRIAATADLYGGIAKIRAVNLGLRQIAQALNINPDGIEARLHGITSARHLTRFDPDTNRLRNGTALLALVLGGAGVITHRPHDWLQGSTPESRRSARNAQHIMAAEARLGGIADAASGAYFIERLTHDLATLAWQKFQTIEAAGGITQMIEPIRQWGREASATRQQAVNSGAEPLLGVTHHPIRQPPLPPIKNNRGGEFRPAEVWEALHMVLSPRQERCLLLDIGTGKAAACAKWFQAVGVEPVVVTAASINDGLATVAAAKPTMLVLGGVENSTQFSDSLGGNCTLCHANDFTGDIVALLKTWVDRL